MTPFARLVPTALAAPVFIMTSLVVTSFATELATPTVTDGHLTAFNIQRCRAVAGVVQLSSSRQRGFDSDCDGLPRLDCRSAVRSDRYPYSLDRELVTLATYGCQEGRTINVTVLLP